MKWLALFVVAVGRLNGFVGRSLAWLALAGVVLCFTVVVQRYVFATTHLWMQDLYVWVNGAMFMGVAGYALLTDAHVRVDIFYRPASVRRKALLDLIGVLLFLLPFCAVVWIWGSEYVFRSWALREASANPGGMPGLYILKTFILVFVFLVALQGLSMLSRSILVLSGRQDLIPERFRYPQE
ncbi:MAG: TRAP transporter small permease subunit [Burkholderiaceae bacterium]|jgi:TRAP-type mannitol/chloroaromatic compound transport system permease small subunit|nr:TRAP transporter small permease subunit [Gemmatimonadales bacterium]MCO5119038.1 TRAP transporter small permease subunit [Burkholderiaceae bacterium]MEB2320198.1 TRAP transporter small permease subunit [Pseudomonadota bacterium]